MQMQASGSEDIMRLVARLVDYRAHGSTGFPTETYFCPNSAYDILIEDVICKKEGLLRFKDLASVGICGGPHAEASA